MKKLAIKFSPYYDTVFAAWGIESRHGMQISWDEERNFVVIPNSYIDSVITPEREAACIAAAEKGPDALHDWIQANVWGASERMRETLREIYGEHLWGTSARTQEELMML